MHRPSSGGTLTSALIFIALTVDFHRRGPEFAHNERVTDKVVRGKQVWHKYNCNDRHTILGFGGYYAPDMTKAYCRLGVWFFSGVVMTVWHLFTLRPEQEKA